jgi:hypothetical protein
MGDQHVAQRDGISDVAGGPVDDGNLAIGLGEVARSAAHQHKRDGAAGTMRAAAVEEARIIPAHPRVNLPQHLPGSGRSLRERAAGVACGSRRMARAIG